MDLLFLKESPENYDIPIIYKDEIQRNKLINMIDSFRVQIADDDKELNILDGQKEKYSDRKIVFLLQEGLKDLNRGTPKTKYTLFTFPDSDLLVKSSIICAMIAEGILQLRNQMNYSDSGFSANIFDKTGGYQGWAGFMLQIYLQDKKDFKSSIIPRSHNSGFIGVSSEMGWY